MRAGIAAKKAEIGPHSNTRSKAKEKSSDNGTGPGKVARIHSNFELDAASLMETVFQEDSERKTIARCDDGIDDSLVCPTLAEPATLSGIGRIKCIEPISL